MKAYENPQSSRWLITTGNFQYQDVCEILKKILPDFSSKIPEPTSTPKVDTYAVDNSHARDELGIHFTPLEQTISDTAKSLVRLQEQAA